MNQRFPSRLSSGGLSNANRKPWKASSVTDSPNARPAAGQDMDTEMDTEVDIEGKVIAYLDVTQEAEQEEDEHSHCSDHHRWTVLPC